MGRGLLGLLILVAGALAVFRTLTYARERQSAEQAAPAAGRLVGDGDKRIFVREEGPASGLPVVLIHGFGAWSETWRRTSAELAGRGFHAIALDLPPFGFSDKITDGSFSREAQARRILGVLDALRLKDVVLVGHSIGARPTVETALLAPDRARALVLVDAALGFGDDGEIAPVHAGAAMRAFFGIRPLRNAVLSATATNPLMTRRLLSTFVADPAVLTPALLSVYQKPFVVRDSTNRLGDWLKVVTVEPEDSLSGKLSNFAKLAMPTLLIWGDKDTITPLWQGEKLKQTIPQSSLRVLKDLGHIPQIEDNVSFNRSLLPFLLELEGARTP